jgi:CBS domain-containing protein
MPGKLDWLAYGLPAERPQAIRTVQDSLEPNIPTASPTETIGALRSRLKNSGKAVLLPVVNDRHVVLGVLDKAVETIDPTTLISDVMNPGPTTVRPYTLVERALDRLEKQNLEAVVVTSSDGELMGIFRRPVNSPHDRLPVTGVWD